MLDGDDYVVNGEKLFITNAVPGRTIGLVCLIDKRPAVLIVDLPDQEDEHFQLVTYGLLALRHLHNHGLRFQRLPRAAREPAPAGSGRRADDRLSRPEPGPRGAVRDGRGVDAGDAGQHASLGPVPPDLRRGRSSRASWCSGGSAGWRP